MQKTTTTQSGLIISYFGSTVAVETADGEIVQCQLHRNQKLPVVGDRVQWQSGNGNTGTVISIEPRSSVLMRGMGKNKLKPIAANVDLLIVVMAPPPIFSNYLVDRYLIAAQLLHIDAALVINKEDLLTKETESVTEDKAKTYKDIGYSVVLSSIFHADTMAQVADLIGTKTVVLVGPSGVGKSSIIHMLGCDEDIKIGEVTSKGGGKHTTTATRLYHLKTGGHVIDSPGVREFNLWPVDKKEILSSFREFAEYSENCRFRDCSHMVEPGCQIQEAVKEGKIYQDRYNTFLELMNKNKQ